MATSGSKSVKVTNYDTLKFSWESTSQSVDNNTTTVKWKLELIAGSSGKIISGVSKSYTVTVNGTKYTGTNTIAIENNATKTIASGNTTISHNADGTKSFSYSFKQEFNITFAGASIGTISGNGTGELNQIARWATITQATNFNDMANPSITFLNPMGNAITTLQAGICLSAATVKNPEIALRSVNKTAADNTYTFQLLESERNILRNATTTSNSRTVYFVLKSAIGDSENYSTLAREFSVDEANPTINPTAIDTDTSMTALTGDNNKIVKYYSDIAYTFNATALKGATIKTYSVICGGKTGSAASGTLSNVESGDITFKVVDSRGNTTTKTLNKTFIAYVKPTCAMAVDAPTTDGQLTVKASGNYFNGSIGNTANTLTVQYRIKANSGSYGSWTAMSATKSGNTYSATATITGLNYQNSYTIQTRIVDKINTVASSEKTVKTTPVFDWGENDFKFNVPVNAKNRFISTNTDTGFRHQHGTSGKAITFGVGGSGTNRGIYDENKGKWLFLYDDSNYKIGDYTIGANNVLWAGGNIMYSWQEITLSQAITAQENGIVLIFSAYSDSKAQDYSFNSFFVPKHFVSAFGGKGHTFIMAASKFGYMATKYLYISDTKITGNDDNGSNGTANGITYNNYGFVLRAVIGV